MSGLGQLLGLFIYWRLSARLSSQEMSKTAKESILTIQKKRISFGNHAILLVCLLNVDTVLKVKGTLDVRENKYAGEQINAMESPVIN